MSFSYLTTIDFTVNSPGSRLSLPYSLFLFLCPEGTREQILIPTSFSYIFLLLESLSSAALVPFSGFPSNPSLYQTIFRGFPASTVKRKTFLSPGFRKNNSTLFAHSGTYEKNCVFPWLDLLMCFRGRILMCSINTRSCLVSSCALLGLLTCVPQLSSPWMTHVTSWLCYFLHTCEGFAAIRLHGILLTSTLTSPHGLLLRYGHVPQTASCMCQYEGPILATVLTSPLDKMRTHASLHLCTCLRVNGSTSLLFS